MAAKKRSKKKKPFKYKGRTALGVKNPTALRNVLKNAEKLTSYEKGLISFYIE